MKNCLIISLFITLSLFACATKPIYSVTIFVIKGRVLDKESNFPLENVKVYFVDTGYDDIRSEAYRSAEIARSNTRGKFEARLNYVWGRKPSGFQNPPKATFDIVLSRESYASKRFHFKQSELPTDRLTFLVDLEDVYMVQNNE